MAAGWICFRGSAQKQKLGQPTADAVLAKTEGLPSPDASGEDAQLAHSRSISGFAKTPAQPSQRSAAPVLVTFEKDVLPIFQSKCVSCHGGQHTKGGLDLRTLAAVRKGGENGPSLTPGSARTSLLWEAVESNRMPPGKSNKLTQAEKMLVQKWINDGTKTNGTTTVQAK